MELRWYESAERAPLAAIVLLDLPLLLCCYCDGYLAAAHQASSSSNTAAYAYIVGDGLPTCSDLFVSPSFRISFQETRLRARHYTSSFVPGVSLHYM